MNIRSIDLNLLGVFVVLMNEQNLTHAAENLGMTQPAVSHSLKRLRTLYNDPLFERKKGKMQPTQRALEMYPLISRVIEEIKGTLPNTNIVKPSELSLEYRVNINNVDNSIFLHTLTQHFLEHAPGVSLIVTTAALHDPALALRNREYDLHVDVLNIEESGCHHAELFRDKIYATANKNHPRLRDLSSITKEQFFAEKHTTLLPKVDTGYVLNKFSKDISIDRDVRYKSESMRDLLQIIQTTDLLCVAPGSLINALPNKSDYIWFELPFDNFEPTIYMNWYWGVEHYPTHRYIRKIIKEICDQVVHL